MGWLQRVHWPAALDLSWWAKNQEYLTTRRVFIQDYRLALISYTLRFLVLIYVVVVQMILSHRYAAFETPAVYANMWPNLVGPPPATVPPYCTDPTNQQYNWGLDLTLAEFVATGGLVMGPNISCQRADSQRHVALGDSSLTIITYERINPVTPLPPGSNFTDTRGGTNYTWYLGTSDSFHTFIDDAEGMTFNMIDVLSASFMTQGVANVRKIVRNKRGDIVADFPAGQALGGIPLRQWLSFAGITLDQRNIQPWLRNGELQHMPFYRQTGVVLLMRLTLSNLRTWELPTIGLGTPICEIKVEVLPLAWGFIGTVPSFVPGLGPVTIARTGVKVQLVFGGQVGIFDTFSVVLRLIEAVVLFNIAAFITDNLARFWLHRDVYKDVIVSRVTEHSIRYYRLKHSGDKGAQPVKGDLPPALDPAATEPATQNPLGDGGIEGVQEDDVTARSARRPVSPHTLALMERQRELESKHIVADHAVDTPSSATTNGSGVNGHTHAHTQAWTHARDPSNGPGTSDNPTAYLPFSRNTSAVVPM